MRSAANSHLKMAKVSRRVPDTSVRGSTSYHAETKSKPACLQTWRKREVRYFEHKHPDFLNSSARTGSTEQSYGDKSWGHFEILFSKKKKLFSIAIHTKQACYLVNILTVNCHEI